MRYFNELMWLPTGYLGDNVQWEAVDDTHARATMTDQGISVTALFTFDEEGRLTNFEADRYCSYTEQIERWSTPLDTYAEFSGLQLPSHGQGVWLLDSGDYSYIELVIEDIRYDVAHSRKPSLSGSQ